MTSLPREAFLPEALAGLAYSDESLTLAPGREVLPPRVLAKLVQLAQIDAGHKTLVISETGYAAAIVATIAAEVIALVPDGGDVSRAGQAFSSSGIANARAVTAAAAAGWPEGQPYDTIVVEGGVEQVPDELSGQLAPGGRLVAISMAERMGRAFALIKSADGLVRHDDFQAAASVLDGFRELKPAFTF
jgi:protein-L-isoaspartate(D-aspartate) O-methyltransferase